MKAIVLQSNLKKALADAAPVILAKPTLPVIANYMLKAQGELLTIAGTNLQTGITRRIGAKVAEEGAIAVPAKLLEDIVGSLPEGEVILTLDPRTLTLKVECGDFVNNIKGVGVDEFPSIPTAARGIELTRLPASEFYEALEQVVFAAASGDPRPLLNGVMLRIAERITLAATDSFRMAIKYVALRTAPLADPRRFVVPATSLAALMKLLKGSEEDVSIIPTPGNAQLVFKTTAAELVTQLIDGDYPDLERVVSPTFATRVTMDAEELARAAKLAGYFAAMTQNVIKVTAKGGGLVVTANAPEAGDNNGKVAATLEGTEGQIAVNVKYLADAIEAAGKKSKITLDFQSAGSPGFVRREGDASWIGVVMPMSIR